MASLTLLGGVSLLDAEGGPSPLAARRHPVTLLALLATTPSLTLSRGQLTGLLWPESTSSRARSRLSTCVHQIRRHLGDPVVRSIGTELALDTGALECDVCSFRAALEAGDPAEAVGLYHGPLLEGFRLPGGVELERRIERERERLRRAFRDALEELARRVERGDPARAARLWRRLNEEDPYDSRVVQHLMRTHAAAANPAAALAVAEEHARLLAEELGTGPPDEVRELAARLRRGEPIPTELMRASTSGPGPSVAILPFAALGASDETRVLAEGLHGDLLTELSRQPSLLVISRSSVLSYRDGSRTPGQIARELGVEAVVEGELQQQGDRVRLRIRLVDPERDVQLWAERYDRELATRDLFELQMELTRKIAKALEARLSTSVDQHRDRPATTDLEAYRLHASGRVHLEQRSAAGLRRAAELFREATERDEGYAAAWAGLAQAITLRMSYYHDLDRAALEEAAKAAVRALALDPHLAEAHVASGLVHYVRTEGTPALDAYRRAIDLRPGYAEAHSLLAYLFLTLGHHERALEPMERANRIDPLSPEALWGSAWIRGVLQDRPTEEALRSVRRAQERSPGYAEAYQLEGEILALAGRPEKALPALRRGLELAGDGARARHLASLLHAFVLVGRAGEAEVLLEEIEATGDAFYTGKGCAVLGRSDDAFHHLGRASWSHPGSSAYLRYDPALDSLRTDPRFRELLTAANVQWGLSPEGSLP